MKKKTRYCRECGSKTNEAHCDICGRKTLPMSNRFNEKNLYILDDDIVSDSDIKKQSKKYMKEQKHQENIKEYRKASERVQTTLPSLQGHEKRYEKNKRIYSGINEKKKESKSILKIIILISIIASGILPTLMYTMIDFIDNIAIEQEITDFFEEIPIDPNIDEDYFIWYSDEINDKEYIYITQPYIEDQDDYFKVTTYNGYDLTFGPHESIYVAMDHQDYYDSGSLLPFDSYELKASISELNFYEDLYVVLDDDITRYVLYYNDSDIDSFVKEIVTYYFDQQSIYENEGIMTINLVKTTFDEEYNIYYEMSHELSIDFNDMSYEFSEILK